MRGILIKHSLFFNLINYFVYGDVECHDDIRNALIEKQEKMLLRKLFSDSKKAPTEEEREAAKQEYLELVGKVRAKAILG